MVFATESPGSRSPGLFIYMLCNFYIDGYNWYHRIDAYYKSTGINYKWLNYKSLCEWIIRKDKEDTVNKIYFFTAIPPQPEKEKYRGSAERHAIYTNALRHFDIEIVQGYFKTKRQFLTQRINGQETRIERITVEEKQTDSNIVAYLLRDAFLNKFGKAFILSADSDIAPAVKIIKELDDLKSKEVVIVPPPFKREDRIDKRKISRKNYFPMHRIDNFLEYTKNNPIKIYFENLSYHLLPEGITDSSGKVIKIPGEYK